ncbi:hypothetical protein LJC20_06375 [Eubacteriales bacterium OttesenSCG-928-M02]|nr:hypothetical protein [Eubacteriales bacterium OttesenSCG-928-M02]
MAAEKTPNQPLNDRESRVFQLLKEGDLNFDALVDQSGIPAGEMAGCLTMMEIKGIIKQLPGRHYCLV